MKPKLLNKKKQKLLNVSSRRPRNHSWISAIIRLVCGVQERRMSERKHVSRSARKPLHAGQRVRLKEQKDREKASQTAYKDNCKASQKPAPRKKQNRGSAAVQSSGVAH
jgi:hypothetical protein